MLLLYRLYCTLACIIVLLPNLSTTAADVEDFSNVTNSNVVITTNNNITQQISQNVSHGVPSNPTRVTAVAFDSKVQVSWDPPADDGSDPILSYEVATFIQDESQPISGNVIISSSVANESVQTFTIIGSLTNGVSYSFKVRANNINGASTWSARSSLVSPLHPPDLCTHTSCSGHGTCFPRYHTTTSDNSEKPSSSSSVCVCRHSYSGDDCSVVHNDTTTNYKIFEYQVSPWSECSSGCNGGTQHRTVTCVDTSISHKAEITNASNCDGIISKPPSTRMCNTVSCGTTLVDVNYEIDMNFDEVLFTSVCRPFFEDAFITELSSALKINPSRIHLTEVTRGSIWVRFVLLPPPSSSTTSTDNDDEKDKDDHQLSLDEVLESLTSQLKDPESVLRTRGTFVRRVNPETLKLSFFLAESAEAGTDEDISVAGLFGTVMVLVAFVSAFAWYLRRRHEKLMMKSGGKEAVERKRLRGKLSPAVSSRKSMKPMGIETSSSVV